MINKNIDKFIQRKFIKSFIDLFVLSEIAKSPLSGYDIMLLLFRKFKVMISPGTVYSLLYSLEREGLIKGKAGYGRKRIYYLTQKGKVFLKEISSSHDNIKLMLSEILDEK